MGDTNQREEAGGPSRGTVLGLWLAAVVAIGLLLFGYHHLAELAEGGSRPLVDPLITELTASLGAGLLLFGVIAFVRRWPLDSAGWRRNLPLYLPAWVVFTVLHTSSNWALRSLIFPLAGLGRYDYGKMPLRYFMEAPIDAIVFTIMVAAIHGVRYLRRTRERELRAARLEQSLAQARLRNLRLQLQPHFLFNALNTISSAMYRDVKAADKMIERLGDLLRASLRTTPTDEVPLATELDALDSYLAIMRARFGERLRVGVDVAPEAAEALVPSTLLQPLVENAIRHGGAERDGAGRIEVRAVREGESLVLTVTDDGPGAAAGVDPLGSGLGLSATAERLRLLYGEAQRFAAGNLPGGGFRVEARIPFATGKADAA